MTQNIKSQKTSPRDFFLHLLHMTALYGSAIAFITLIFQYINLLIPDFAVHGGDWGDRSLKQSLAVLVIMFPVLIVSGWLLNKICIQEPEKKNLPVRRWLVYLTLFIAAVIIIADLIFLVRGFLDGELTLRFILKFMAVFVTAGAIFGYYLYDTRKDEKHSTIDPSTSFRASI